MLRVNSDYVDRYNQLAQLAQIEGKIIFYRTLPSLIAKPAF